MTDPLSWYPWYWQSWRSNRRVQRMNATERGIYRELLDECWIEDSLPPELSALAEIADCTIEEMTAAWPALALCFSVDNAGRLWNAKMRQVRHTQTAAHLRSVARGRKAGNASAEKKRKRTNDLATSVAHPLNTRSTDVNHKSRLETTLNSGGAGPQGPPPRLPDANLLPPVIRPVCGICDGRNGDHASDCALHDD